MENPNEPTIVRAENKHYLSGMTPTAKTLTLVVCIALLFVGSWIFYNAKTSQETTAFVPISENKTILVPLSNTPIIGSVVAEKPLDENAYIPKRELDPLIVKEARAEENRNRLKNALWGELADGYLDERVELSVLNAESATPLGSGYYTLESDGYIHWVGVRHVYGDSSYVVHAIIQKEAVENATFKVLYSSEGSDLITYGKDTVFIRKGERWAAIPALTAKTIRFLTPETDKDKYAVFYFTDETNVYAMYGSRPYEGCCTVMTEHMFTIEGADLASFTVIDEYVAKDKNNTYTAAISEKGAVSLTILTNFSK